MESPTARNSPGFKQSRNEDPSFTITDSTRASWNEPQRAFLVSLLMEYNTPVHRTDNGWNREAWNEMVERFAERFPAARFNTAQIKDQQQRLRKQCASLKRILSMRGVGWNDNLKQIDFENSALEEALINDKEVRQWHQKPFPYFNDLCQLFKDNSGTDARKSGRKPVKNHENGEQELNSPSLTITPPGRSPHADVDNELLSTSLREPIICSEPEDLPSPRVAAFTQPRTSTQDMSSSKAIKLKKRKAIGNFHGEYLSYKREEPRLVCATMETHPLESAGRAERFSISAAMIAFQDLEGFGIRDLFAASKMFMADAGIREAFLSCYEKNRAGWIRLMIDQYKVKPSK